MKIKNVRPNLLSVLVFAGLLAFQFYLVGTTIISPSGKVTQVRGMGSITTTHLEGKTSHNLHWHILIPNLVLCYALAHALSWIAVHRGIVRRPMIVYPVLLALISLVGLGVGAFFSKHYWGYYFRRPSLPSQLSELAAVTSLFPVETHKGASGAREFVTRKDASIAKDIDYCAGDPYYCLSERMLVFLRKRQLLPSSYATDLPSDLSLHQHLSQSRLVTKPDDGYDTSLDFHGVMLDGKDAQGRRLIFLAVTGGQLSNDHYPYIESIWRGEANTRVALEQGQTFFFDVAGKEGLECKAIWFLVTVAGAVIVLPSVAIVSGFLGLLRKRPNQAL